MMFRRYSAFILLVFLTVAVPVANAGQAQNAVNLTSEQPAPPVFMSDEALASYITGRLKQALQDDNYKVDQVCNDDGCSVVVH